jgi:hypothetical protein
VADVCEGALGLCLPETPYALCRLRLRAFSDSLQAMSSVVVSLLHSLRFTVRSRGSLHLEIIALRHQLAVVHRSRRPRLRLTSVDRMLWAWLVHTWCGWRSAVYIVEPETVVAWHRRGFRLFWTWKSRHRTGRPGVPHDVRALIRDLSAANPLWEAPRIHGELLKLGISVSQFDRRNACDGTHVHRRKRGGHSSPIMPTRSWPPTSSSCRRSRSDCCSCS